MSTHTHDGRTAEPTDSNAHTDPNTRTESNASADSDARPVGPHLVVGETAWVPGAHPESHRRVDGQRGYAERYFRCLRCGAERLRTGDFPAECRSTSSSERRTR